MDSRQERNYGSSNQYRSPSLPQAEPFRPRPLYQASGYASDISRVNTIDSTTSLPNTNSSPPQSYSTAASEQDSDSGAIEAWRYRDQVPPPGYVRPSYPERTYPHPQQFQRVDSQPNNALTGFVERPTNQGTGSTGGFAPPPRTDTWGSQPSWAPNQRGGHKYGKVTIKGDGRVIQGNAYDQHAPPAWLRDHEYEGVEIDGRGSLIMGDVRVSALPVFWGLEHGALRPPQPREHEGESHAQTQLPGR